MQDDSISEQTLSLQFPTRKFLCSRSVCICVPQLPETSRCSLWRKYSEGGPSKNPQISQPKKRAEETPRSLLSGLRKLRHDMPEIATGETEMTKLRIESMNG